MTYRAGKHFLINFFLFQAFLWPQIIFAADPPTLISPSDNSTESNSPKLTWQYSGECFEGGSCFRVEVDNNSDFSSAEKTTYDKDTSYSPKGLTEGSWYWRVKAKDKSEKWSDWSQVFKFNIGAGSASPAPAPNESTAKTSDPKKSENIFDIKDAPNEINSDQEFEISVSLKIPDKSNADFYLKGAFKKDGSSNYFGQTYVGEWVANGEKYSKQLKITTDSSGNWERKIKVKPDAEDSGFDGTDEYIFKVARYTDSGNGPTWSNELKIKINQVVRPEPSSEEIEEIIEEDNEVMGLTYTPETASPSYEIKIASVAGTSTIIDNIIPETKILAKKEINWLLVISGLGVLIAGGGFVIYKYKKEKIVAKSYN